MGRANVALRDWAVAVGVAAVVLVAGLGLDPGGGAPADLTARAVGGLALLVAGGLALAVRRRAPVAVLVVTGLCAVGGQAAGLDVPAVAYVVAVYAAVRAGHRTVAVVVSLLVLGALPLATMVTGPLDTGAAFARARGVLELAWLIAAGAAGEAVRQAERRADEAERTREEAALRRAGEERLHIARELHDSLTHQISVITVQAEAAVHVARRRGEPVPDALLAIRDAGREASRELRATLETLRDDGANAPCGLDRLPELVARARAAGLDATLTIAGERTGVPAAVERAAYRIVQESLTNIARHAAAATATVRVEHLPGRLTVRVEDDGTARPDAVAEPGVGLRGMRERVTALGGRLRVGPRPTGGFAVEADLPLTSAAESSVPTEERRPAGSVAGRTA
ncbi:two-component sensor histidine kinase [Virgisporangium aliadipatigenens]|uniref:histidine kinase n=1 Tax=Virgisporangium aliadipatigenens TaxID=741659 RepID=A0A8J3YGI9_9ACTN|nr:histidine kinase [Virgisporangium aliadipatigenens]GIJ43837.1 two-component sensor histidine kinase [Virgisporangium aliadipatigenens]